MPFNKRYKIPRLIELGVFAVCIMPLLLNLAGIDFGTVKNSIDPYKIKVLVDYEQRPELKDVILGRNFHTIFVSFTIAIAFLTVILAFIDYRIKGDVSTPIVGIALFCAGMFDTFHMLVSAQVIHVPSQQFYLTSFTWFFCRLFHATILILGVGIFLVRSDLFEEERKENARRFVFYSATVFIMLTLITIATLFSSSDIAPLRIGYPYKNIARSYDLIPLALYVASAIFIFPKFYEKHPSTFSQTLVLSAIPAIAAQLYMAFGSNELYDNNFNVSHFLTAVTYFFPFVGLSLNYVQTHKNEQHVIAQLNREVTERKHTEDVLSGVLNSSLSSIMAFRSIRNSAGHIIDFEWILLNPSSEQIFHINYKKAIGKRLSKEMPLALAEKWLDMFSYVIDSGIPLNHEYYSEGLKKWLLLAGVKLDDGIAVTISDISKRKNALKELVDAERLAVTGRISRTIAHEVRNPLTTINLSLDQLNEDLESPTERTITYLDMIRRNSARVNQLITELLNSSKPAQLEITKRDVNSLMEEMLALAIDRIHLKKIRLEKNYGTNLPAVNVDVEKIKLALLNLVINAVEAMEEGTGILWVRTYLKGGRCIIEIEDNGSGISKENLENLFVPFFSKKSQGMGLGLTAAQNIIISHKGTIDVESTIGKGTKFIISL